MQDKKFYPTKRYIEFQQKAISNLEKFWEKEAEKLPWFKRWDKVLQWEEPYARWFIGGLLNASYGCLDVHCQRVSDMPRKNTKEKLSVYAHEKTLYVELHEPCRNTPAF